MRSEENGTPLAAHNGRQDSITGPCPNSGRAPFIVFQQPAERLVTDNVFQSELAERSRRWQRRIDWHVAEPLVRPTFVIEFCPLGEDVPQVALAEDDEVVQDFCACAAHPAFAIGIQVGRSRWNRAELDTIGFQDGTELLGELRVPIANDVSGLELHGLFAEEHAHVASYLGHPDAVRIGRHAGGIRGAGF